LQQDTRTTQVQDSGIAVLGIRGIPGNYGGLETCAEQVTKVWAEKGHSVLVYCRRERYPERIERIGAIRLKYTRSIQSKCLGTLSHTFVSVLDLLMFERKVRMVHLYNTGNGIFAPLLKLFGKRVIVSGDGLEWKRDKWNAFAKFVHKIGEWMAIKFADRVVVDNEEVRKYYVNKYRQEPALITYGAKLVQCEPHAAEVLARYGLKAKKYFLFVGRLVPEKGVHELVKAYKRVNTDYPLVIIGDDLNTSAYRNELLRQQSDRIRFVGFLYGKDYEQLLVNALLYVSASRLEGTSPSLLAAMGAQVCSLVNGIEENHATADGGALMFEKDNYDHLQQRWQQLVDAPALIEEWAAKGRSYVLDHYRWDAIASEYLSVFGQCSERREVVAELQ
jgi:glycosyltransferase involved in cell wall biosynthesis